MVRVRVRVRVRVTMRGQRKLEMSFSVSPMLKTVLRPSTIPIMDRLL